MTVKLDGATLGIQDVVRVARRDAQGAYAQAALAPEARERIAATRDYIDRTWMHDDAPLMYAFNTGVGLFKDQRVLINEMEAYQRNTVYAHATGAVCGFAEAEMVYKGRRMPAREAISKAGFDPDFPLGAKDASALINGSTT